MSDFKLGPIDGAAALIVLVVAILAAVCLVAVLIVSIIKAVKERNDQKEDQAENEFFAEYGVTGEELRLNQKIAQKRKELFELMRKKVRKVKDEPVVEEVKDKPVEEDASAVEPEQEPVREETIAQEEVAPVVEEVKQEEPVPVEPVQEPQKEETKEEVKGCIAWFPSELYRVQWWLLEVAIGYSMPLVCYNVFNRKARNSQKFAHFRLRPICSLIRSSHTFSGKCLRCSCFQTS